MFLAPYLGNEGSNVELTCCRVLVYIRNYFLFLKWFISMNILLSVGKRVEQTSLTPKCGTYGDIAPLLNCRYTQSKPWILSFIINLSILRVTLLVLLPIKRRWWHHTMHIYWTAAVPVFLHLTWDSGPLVFFIQTWISWHCPVVINR